MLTADEQLPLLFVGGSDMLPAIIISPACQDSTASRGPACLSPRNGRMNILFINHYAGSRLHGMVHRPFYLSREWVKEGHHVTVVAASYAHVRSRNPSVCGSTGEETIDGIRYLWLKTPSYQGNGMGRVANMLTFLARLCRSRKRVTETGKPDVVISSSTYVLDILPAYSIARRCGSKLVFEVRDLWPLTPKLLGGMSQWHPFVMALQWAEGFAYRRSDRVVSALPYAYEYMISRGMAAEKFVYVPNGIDPDQWTGPHAELPARHMEELGRLREQGRFLVGFAGFFGLAAELRTLLDAAVLLDGESVHFVLVGNGPEKQRLQQRVRGDRIDNVTFLPSLQHECMVKLLGSMDALYVGLKKSPVFRFGVSPNKLLEYMMVGKPVILAVGAGRDVVNECDCGISVQPEDAAALARAVRALSGLSAPERMAMGLRGTRYVSRHHDYAQLARRFLDHLQ